MKTSTSLKWIAIAAFTFGFTAIFNVSNPLALAKSTTENSTTENSSQTKSGTSSSSKSSSAVPAAQASSGAKASPKASAESSVEGTIQKVVAKKKEIYVNPADGTKKLEFYFPDNAQYLKGDQTVGFEMLQEGQKVRVTFTKTGKRLNPTKVEILN